MAEGTSKAVKALAIGLGLALVVIGLFVAREIFLKPPDSAAPDATPIEAAGPEAAEAKPAPAGPLDPDERYRIQQSDGGVLLTNQPGSGGTIQEKDGQILLSAKGEPGPEPTATPARDPASGAAPSPAPAADPEAALRTEVRDYLTKVATLQAGPAGVNPRNYADGLVDGLAKGDRSGFDELMDQVERVRDEARAIDPPGPCREHHELLVSITEQSVELMEELIEALSRNDTTKLQFMTGKSKTLQDQTKRLEQLEQQLRQRYQAF